MVCFGVPQRVTLPPVVKIQYGQQHALALTVDGHLYTWGQNGDGQLGIADDQVQNANVPRLIRHPRPCLDLACGLTASVFVDQNGEVYYCGRLDTNPYSSSSSFSSYSSFTHLPIPGGGRVVAVSCGHWHMMLLTQDGCLFAMGCNYSGQLGTGDQMDQVEPQLVLTQVRSVKCHTQYTVAIQWDGSLYEWGSLPGRGEEAILLPTPTTFS